MKKPTIIQILVALFIFLFGTCVGAVGCFVWLLQDDQTSGVELLASRLNIQPNLSTVQKYVYCDLLPLNTSRMKVEEDLTKVGLYYKKEDNHYTNYVFEHPSVAFVIGELSLSFDKEDHLVTKEKKAGLGDYQNLEDLCK